MNRSPSHLMTAFAGLVSLLVLAACSGSTPGSSAGSGGDSSTLNLAFLGSITAPDPDTAYQDYELNLVNNAYEGLLTFQPGSETPKLVGALATSWSVNSDNTVFTFELRRGVKFHDGTQFTSAAVKPSFDRRLAIGEGPSYMVADVKNVATPSKYKVVITLKSPNSAFLELLASPFGPKMVSPKAIKAHPVSEGSNWFDTHDAGTGPYEYGTIDPGDSYSLKRFDGYWGKQAGYENVHFSVLSDMTTIQLQLKSGRLDGLIGTSGNSVFAGFEKEESLTAYTFPSMLVHLLFVNPDSPTLGSKATRLALLSGIDFPKTVEDALDEIAEPTTQVFPNHLLPKDKNQQVIQHDKDALASLAEGALKEKTIEIAYPSVAPAEKDLSDNLAAVLNRAGIKAKSVGYSRGTFFPAVESGKDGPDIAFMGGFPDTAHPASWAQVFYRANGGLNLFSTEIPGIEPMLDNAVRTDDTATYAKVVKMVSGSGYWYSVGPALGTAVFQKDVAGVEGSYDPIITNYLNLALLHPAP